MQGIFDIAAHLSNVAVVVVPELLCYRIIHVRTKCEGVRQRVVKFYRSDRDHIVFPRRRTHYHCHRPLAATSWHWALFLYCQSYGFMEASISSWRSWFAQADRRFRTACGFIGEYENSVCVKVRDKNVATTIDGYAGWIA